MRPTPRDYLVSSLKALAHSAEVVGVLSVARSPLESQSGRNHTCPSSSTSSGIDIVECRFRVQVDSPYLRYYLRSISSRFLCMQAAPQLICMYPSTFVRLQPSAPYNISPSFESSVSYQPVSDADAPMRMVRRQRYSLLGLPSSLPLTRRDSAL